MTSRRRHESLVPLSREHHYGLMLCLRIHRGLGQYDNDEAWVRERADQATQFFATDLVPHFKAEEEALFPAMREFAGAPELLNRLLAEHRKLEALANRLRGADVAELLDALREFSDLLEAHIRTEERELFPLYERLAGDEVAAKVSLAVRDIIGEAMRPRSQ